MRSVLLPELRLVDVIGRKPFRDRICHPLFCAVSTPVTTVPRHVKHAERREHLRELRAITIYRVNVFQQPSLEVDRDSDVDDPFGLVESTSPPVAFQFAQLSRCVLPPSSCVSALYDIHSKPAKRPGTVRQHLKHYRVKRRVEPERKWAIEVLPPVGGDPWEHIVADFFIHGFREPVLHATAADERRINHEPSSDQSGERINPLTEQYLWIRVTQ